MIAISMLLSNSQVFAQHNSSLKSKPTLSTFVKPVFMFDNATATVVPPPREIADKALKLRTERGLDEALVSLRDKRGLRRIAFTSTENNLTNCTPYADMYFDARNTWLSTEEFFSVEADSATGLGRLVQRFAAQLDAKGYRIGVCEVGGGIAVWRISTPVLTWYECEIFKKSVDSNYALALTLDKEPYSVPNPYIYGTAYFDERGTLMRIQAKSKVKMAAANR
ncbi:MAG: hypothetical protein NZ661_02955 [Candidatus Kapabacteria bacterium]|nr:hypothetical protein [Candidatus Kapabacteria bacterium]